MATSIKINWQPTHLENELVKLIPLSETDFEALYQIASDPLIWEQHPNKDRYKREVFRTFFDDAIKSKGAFLIVEKSSNKAIGSTRYYDATNSSITIGYTFFGREFWGGQYNKATKKLMIDYAFQFVDKIHFHIGAENIRSQKGIEKLGAVKVNEYTDEKNGMKAIKFEYLIEKKNWK